MSDVSDAVRLMVKAAQKWPITAVHDAVRDACAAITNGDHDAQRTSCHVYVYTGDGHTRRASFRGETVDGKWVMNPKHTGLWSGKTHDKNEHGEWVRSLGSWGEVTVTLEEKWAFAADPIQGVLDILKPPNLVWWVHVTHTRRPTFLEIFARCPEELVGHLTSDLHDPGVIGLWTRLVSHDGEYIVDVKATFVNSGKTSSIRWTLIIPEAGEGTREKEFASIEKLEAELEEFLRARPALFDAPVKINYTHRRVETTRIYGEDPDVEPKAQALCEFWEKSKQEFIEKTWHPSRLVKWCLPHDEVEEWSSAM